jgi:azurin
LHSSKFEGLGPGEEEIVSFTAPKEKGAYEYVCTFPGHVAMMRGTMTVQTQS